MSIDLKEESRRIGQSFKDLIVSLSAQHEDAVKKKEEIMEVLQKAVSEGDLSENSAYTAAVDDLSVCTRNIVSLRDSIRNAEAVKEDFSSYEPIGMVVLYTTVLLRRDDTGEEYVVKLYPEGVSDLEKGIISKDSPIGNAIWHKEKGDSFHLSHRATGEDILWKIVDIY